MKMLLLDVGICKALNCGMEQATQDPVSCRSPKSDADFVP
jgi:hypothetical protein